jgi:hypothetical protein
MPDLKPVWAECFRVLRRGGSLLVGFVKPELFIFDLIKAEEEQAVEVRYKLPYSEVESLSAKVLAAKIESHEPLEYSHTLEDQIGGQTEAGFHIVGLFEDRWADDDHILNSYFPNFVATRAIKP